MEVGARFARTSPRTLRQAGITVVGVDVKEYLVNFASPQKPVSADQLTRDYARNHTTIDGPTRHRSQSAGDPGGLVAWRRLQRDRRLATAVQSPG